LVFIEDAFIIFFKGYSTGVKHQARFIKNVNYIEIQERTAKHKSKIPR